MVGLLDIIKNNPTVELVEAVESVYEQYHKNCHPYSIDNILYSISKAKDHPRYELTNRLYVDGLKDGIKENCHFIDEFLQRQFVREADKPKFIPPNIRIIYTDDIDDDSEDSNDIKIKVVKDLKPVPDNSHSYAFSKLHNPDHPFGLSYFKREFSNDKEIMTELENMSILNSAEFHISYEYLRQMLLERKLIHNF